AYAIVFFFSSRRRHTRFSRDWSSDVCSSDLILALKIFHMEQETLRTDVEQSHIQSCQAKLDVLLEQRKDLSQSIDELLQDIADGRKVMKVYKQMKMYNDPTLNPVLYGSVK